MVKKKLFKERTLLERKNTAGKVNVILTSLLFYDEVIIVLYL